jgi:hypothetical protein
MNVLRIDAVKMREGANACVPEESLILANHGSTKIRHHKHMASQTHSAASFRSVIRDAQASILRPSFGNACTQ